MACCVTEGGLGGAETTDEATIIISDCGGTGYLTITFDDSGSSALMVTGCYY